MKYRCSDQVYDGDSYLVQIMSYLLGLLLLTVVNFMENAFIIQFLNIYHLLYSLRECCIANSKNIYLLSVFFLKTRSPPHPPHMYPYNCFLHERIHWEINFCGFCEKAIETVEFVHDLGFQVGYNLKIDRCILSMTPQLNLECLEMIQI